MKQAVKAFLTILALVLGSYLLRIGTGTEYHDPDFVLAIIGVLLITGGLTSVWMHYKDRISK